MSRASGGGERRRSRTTILEKEQMTQMNCLQLLIQARCPILGIYMLTLVRVLYLQFRSVVRDPRLSLSLGDYGTHLQLKSKLVHRRVLTTYQLIEQHHVRMLF